MCFRKVSTTEIMPSLSAIVTRSRSTPAFSPSLCFLLAALASGSCAQHTPEAPEALEVHTIAEGLNFTEGPVWIDREQRLIFSDIPERKLLSWTAEAGVQTWRDSPHPNGNLLDSTGRLLTCRHGARDLVRTEADGTLTVLASHFAGKRLNSPNDLAVRDDGSIWFTDPPWGLPRQREGRELEWNGVYCLAAEGQDLQVIRTEHAMPNGIAWSPDYEVLYVSDTGGHPSHPDPARHSDPPQVFAYAVDTAGQLDPQPLWTAPVRSDGMTVDSHGRIYTTTPQGITVLSAAGEILLEIPLEEAPTNCCFGADESRLFVTARSRVFLVRLPRDWVRGSV